MARPPTILVIADDLTGAAEIAGIGLESGLSTRLVRDRGFVADPGLTVLDTDSRLASPPGAIQILERLLTGVKRDAYDLIYKKVDSVLRGAVLTELELVLARFGFAGTLLVPQNPSRGRVIERGVYKLEGQPLHTTHFAFDPHHPAMTSQAIRLLGHSDAYDTRLVDLSEPTLAPGILVANGTSSDEVASWASRCPNDFLPAGGADFFRAVISRLGREKHPPAAQVELPAGKRLFVCGTSVHSSREAVAGRAAKAGIPRVSMPDDIVADLPTASEQIEHWARDVSAALSRHGAAVADIAHPIQPSGGRQLERAIGRMVASALAATPVDCLLMEGGATAAAVCSELRLTSLDAIAELEPGVVALRPARRSGPMVVVKPGSYSWPERVWNRG